MLNQELRKIVLSLYQREVSSGVTQPPVSEWRSPTLSSLEKVQPKPWELSPKSALSDLGSFHLRTRILSHPHSGMEFWNGEQVARPPPAPQDSVGSFHCRAVPSYLSSPITSSLSPLSNPYPCYTRVHHSRSLPYTNACSVILPGNITCRLKALPSLLTEFITEHRTWWAVPRSAFSHRLEIPVGRSLSFTCYLSSAQWLSFTSTIGEDNTTFWSHFLSLPFCFCSCFSFFCPTLTLLVSPRPSFSKKPP